LAELRYFLILAEDLGYLQTTDASARAHAETIPAVLLSSAFYVLYSGF